TQDAPLPGQRRCRKGRQLLRRSGAGRSPEVVAQQPGGVKLRDATLELQLHDVVVIGFDDELLAAATRAAAADGSDDLDVEARVLEIRDPQPSVLGTLFDPYGCETDFHRRAPGRAVAQRLPLH